MTTMTIDRRAARTWLPLAATATGLAAFVTFLVVPYLVGGLYRFPLAQVADTRPSTDMVWPQPGGGILALVFGLGGIFALLVSPWVATIGTLVAAHDVMRPAGRSRKIAVAALLIGLAFIALAASPLGRALVAWGMD